MNTFAVEQAAAAVPADAWTNVAPAEVWLTLPSPDDASATRKLLREGLCTSLRFNLLQALQPVRVEALCIHVMRVVHRVCLDSLPQ